jgi:predicted XRE-type DNA-binding protein
MTIEKATKNLFEDLGFTAEEASDLKYRAELFLHIRKICEREGYSRRDLEKILDVPQPRVSELMTGKIDRFSADKLLGIIDGLGYVVQFKLKRA